MEGDTPVVEEAPTKVDNVAVIFDFDGTLADSLYATLYVLYSLIHRKPLPAEDISRLRGMTMVQVLRELKVPLWRALFLKDKVHNAMRDHMDDIALVPGIDEAVKALAANHKLYIVSSNDVANVRVFLGRFQMQSYFVGIYGDANPFSKAKLLKKVMHENNLDPKRTWYIGDQAWDIKAAHKVRAKAAAVAWGFSNIHVLKSRKPEALIFSPDELAPAVASGTESQTRA